MNAFDDFRQFKFYGISEIMSRICDEENELKYYQILELQFHHRHDYLPPFLSVATEYRHRFQPLVHNECETGITQCITTPTEWIDKLNTTYVRKYMFYCKLSSMYSVVVYEYPTDQDPFC